MKRQLSRDDIGNQGRVLLNDFIHERLYQDHVESIPAVEELQEPGTPSGLYLFTLSQEHYLSYRFF